MTDEHKSRMRVRDPLELRTVQRLITAHRKGVGARLLSRLRQELLTVGVGILRDHSRAVYNAVWDDLDAPP